MSARIAVASIIQETNTFSPCPSTMDDFTAHGLWTGSEAAQQTRGTNTEIAGAIEQISAAAAEPVPILRAWAMSGGTLTASAWDSLREMLVTGLAGSRADALVLCLHGALVAESALAADAALTAAARAVLGPDIPIVVTHDLHANVTRQIVENADAILGYRTYPHVDQGDTGRRAAALALRILLGPALPAGRILPGPALPAGRILHGPALPAGLDPRGAGDRVGRVGTVLAKRPMLVPAESQALADPPMRRLRALADAATGGRILDVSLFPVQPWLDVPELGFGVTVTHAGDPAGAAEVAERIAGQAWADRESFAIDPVPVEEAIRRVRERATGTGVVLLVHSADSPTAGATADSATVIEALLQHGRGLRALATVVDAPAVDACFSAGTGATVHTMVGATLDPRWSRPVALTGVVTRTGADPVTLAGDSMTGQHISMGRWSTVDTGDGLVVLVTERPAPTFDPAGYRHAGLEPADVDTVVVRSATMYRAGFQDIHDEAILLDLPGASTPQFGYLTFSRAPRPLYPLDGR